MSTNSQQLAGGSLLIPDSKYRFGQLRLSHWTEYAQFVGFQDYYKAKRNDPPDDLLKELFREGLAKDYSPTSPEVLKSFNDPICMEKLLEISLRIGNPGITEKEIQDLLSNDELLSADLLSKFLEIQGLVAEKK
jgi:hypothetical protein